MNIVKRGEIYFADLNPIVGSEQNGVRPIVIIQNEMGNKFSPTTIVAAITSNISKTQLPTHVAVPNIELPQNSIILLEQIRTIDKKRLFDFVGLLDADTMKKVDKAIEISFGLEYSEVLRK